MGEVRGGRGVAFVELKRKEGGLRGEGWGQE